MSERSLSRRQFLQGAGGLSGAALLRTSTAGLAAALQAACSARDAGSDFRHLDPDAAAALDALTARIIPTTDTPGAREAGVTWFIDEAIGGFMAPARETLLEGLADFEAAIPDGKRFVELDEAAQDAHIATQDQSPFFGLVGLLTRMGTFGLPAHGGNRDYVGWQLLGIDPQAHAHLPPFGHYDAAAHVAGEGGAADGD